MTPPNYFRFVKVDESGGGGGGGGVPSHEYRHRFANSTGLTEHDRWGGSSNWQFETETVNSVANVPYVRPGSNNLYFYWEIDDNSSIDTTLNSNAWTVSFWYNHSGNDFYTSRIGIETGNIRIDRSNNQRFKVKGPWGTGADTEVAFTNSTWHHFALVVDKSGSTAKFYLDGTLELDISLTAGNVTSLAHTNGNHIRLYHDNDATMDAAPGANDKFADFRLFSSALTASEISDVMDDIGSS